PDRGRLSKAGGGRQWGSAGSERIEEGQKGRGQRTEDKGQAGGRGLIEDARRPKGSLVVPVGFALCPLPSALCPLPSVVRPLQPPDGRSGPRPVNLSLSATLVLGWALSATPRAGDTRHPIGGHRGGHL